MHWPFGPQGLLAHGFAKKKIKYERILISCSDFFFTHNLHNVDHYIQVHIDK
jgi:hypothetical protein